jgi:F-type H+-transporting ATPase subunit gamma
MIIEYTIPMILDAIVHETLLEAKASEHAARMVAMKNAKDSANKKAAGLTLVYNKTRQSAITKEVSEIVSGVESMKDA